jgi:hypothetical protein
MSSLILGGSHNNVQCVEQGFQGVFALTYMSRLILGRSHINAKKVDKFLFTKN